MYKLPNGLCCKVKMSVKFNLNMPAFNGKFNQFSVIPYNPESEKVMASRF